jgi:hypothetical protein
LCGVELGRSSWRCRDWRLPPTGMPLCLAGAFSYVAPNMFAGRIFNLKPGTDYEARFTLSDPACAPDDAV